MKTLSCVLVAAAILCAAAASFAATPEVYVLSGPVLANLGTDGVQFGRDMASALDMELGGDWQSSKAGKFGPDLALGVHTRSDRTLGQAVEVRYVRRGARYTMTDASGNYGEARLKLHLDYVEIPVLLEISPPSASAARAMFLVGPVLSINTKSSLVAEAGGQSASSDVAKQVKDTHLDAMLGAGARLRTGPGTALLVQARFSYDLGNLFGDQAGYDVRSRDLSLLIGYAFGR